MEVLSRGWASTSVAGHSWDSLDSRKPWEALPDYFAAISSTPNLPGQAAADSSEETQRVSNTDEGRSKLDPLTNQSTRLTEEEESSDVLEQIRRIEQLQEEGSDTPADTEGNSNKLGGQFSDQNFAASANELLASAGYHHFSA
ncbi:uncharacterized protein IL334_007878 [Kwoniella shivajii]|uniref:Uncharacterized protein n=1 Tax=Kwoniella shivajii TaxID=564305 RepID=A0ABZ1DC48_9TREE|nr:hypothetical protein IL334_007878 [Kwoniella shivajii]